MGHGMEEFERGFHIIYKAVKTQKFAKRELEGIVKISQALVNDTQKLLDRINKEEKTNKPILDQFRFNDEVHP